MNDFMNEGKTKVLNLYAVNSDLGLHILNCAVHYDV